MKPKPLTEAQFLTFLDKTLAKLISDLKLRASIQEEVSKEIRLHNNVASFVKYAESASVPDLKPETVAELQDQLAATFGSDAKVEITAPAEKDAEGGGGALAVEITLPDRIVNSEIRVGPAGGPDDGDGAPKAPFVPFPVTLPQDAELVWVLARREDLGPDEAARALAHIEDEFWGSKTGQKIQREGTEKTFAEFIANVPAAALLESGLKRHYKEPETLHSLRLLHAKPADDGLAGLAMPEIEMPAA